MALNLIVAFDVQGLIGSKNSLPWRLPLDLAWFKKCTYQNTLILGRATYDSLPKRPLPNRKHVILSRTPQKDTEQVLWVPSVSAALEKVSGDSEVFVAGGASIYAHFLPYVSKLYITRVQASLHGDTFFPSVNWDQWVCVWQEAHPADQSHAYPFCFEVYEPNIKA